MPKAVTPACDACRSRKIKCDKLKTCSQCGRLGLKCTYSPKVNAPRKRIKRGAILALYTSHGLKQQKANREAGECNDGGSTAGGMDAVGDADADSVVESESEIHGMYRFSKQFFWAVLDTYMRSIYPMFPILARPEIIESIERLHDDETHASFLHAMAAVTIGHTGLHLSPGERKIVVPRLADIAIDLKGAFRRNTTIDVRAVMTSVLISSVLVGIQDVETAWLYLREAITMATIMKMGDPVVLQSFDLKERARRQRLFWMLYIHERFMAIHFYRPVILAPIDMLPEADEQIPHHINHGFVQLIKLFRLVDSNFINALLGVGNSTLCVTHSWLEQKQREIKSSACDIGDLSEMQQVDIIITQQWLRVMVWQMAMSRYILSDEISEGSLSLLFPVAIGNRVRELLTRVSAQSIQVHGMALIHKLFELAVIIADILVCISPERLHSQHVNGATSDFLWLADYLIKQNALREPQKVILEKKIATISQSDRHPQGQDPGLAADSCMPSSSGAYNPWQSISQCLETTADAVRETDSTLLPLIPHLGNMSELSQELLNDMDLAQYSSTNGSLA